MPLNSGVLQTGTTGTTAQANEVVIGGIAMDYADNFGSPTGSFTEVTERSSGTPDLIILERIVSSTGTFGSSVTPAGSVPLTWKSAGALISLKEAAPAGFDAKKSSTLLTFF